MDRLLPTTVSAVSKHKHNMPDTESSGAATPAAETVNAPSVPATPNPDLPPSTFGNSRGSGLARGKRPVSPPAQAASAAPAADYKPTAVSILTAPTEYKNPFAPPAPAVAAPEAPAAEAPAPASPPVPIAEVPAPAATPAAEPPPAVVGAGPAAAAEPEPMPELKILPPETPKRVEHNWESQSFRNVAAQAREEQDRSAESPLADSRPRRDERRGDRPVFRPERERSGDRPTEFRPAGGESGRTAGGEPRRFASGGPGRPEAAFPPKAAEPKKTGGFFGWLKRIFGGPSAEPEAPAPDTHGEKEFGHEGQYRRRRHRGGRGRNFRGDQRGPRDGPRDGQPGGQPSGGPRGQGGEHFHHGGRRRRRHNGGGYRNDSRPEGGYRGGDSRPESGYRGDVRPEGGPPPGGS